ncbi:hypothetical protein KII92_02425 [Leuconostoc gelidum subsp. gasicomitatum]|uniref:hypothetical protein n=1 Tax=Leuconostoc gasicomitatum TaxID=115778 RepID=UPI001CC50095|nr:hypothetical protein [Leuconostoc gasicomitatum]MBZ5943813.1 hypothetical protein [Leuconostoc gasicomitatum]MBZ5965548.1 hypothetical protein [Leuconostoc gasicomitatum]
MTIKNRVVDKKKSVSILNDDIELRINSEKEHIFRPNTKKGFGKMQMAFTLLMGVVVLFGIIYSLISQLH